MYTEFGMQNGDRETFFAVKNCLSSQCSVPYVIYFSEFVFADTIYLQVKYSLSIQ